MIFWILLVAVTVAVIVTFAANLDAQYGDWVLASLGAFLALALGCLISAGIVLLFTLIPAQSVQSDDYQLRALATSGTTSGSFFLGSGYVGEERTLNFIRSQGGYSQLDYALAANSRVYEDADKPTFTEYVWRYDNPWVLPWTVVTGYSYDFHVPAGSVLENYDITN